MQSLHVSIGPVGFEHPIVNAAGTCKTTDEFERLARSSVSGIVVGSITKEPRERNTGNTWASIEAFSINSLGLPNGGLPYYETELPRMVDIGHVKNKAVIASVAGFSPEETAELVVFSARNLVDMIEINLGCPNVWSDGQQKPIASYSAGVVAETLAAVHKATLGNTDGSIVYGYKFSPLEPMLLSTIAAMVNEYPVSFVTTSNTFPNCFGYDEAGKKLIDSKDVPEGFGGGAGPGFRMIAMGQVKQFRKHLRSDIRVNGVGGVSTGRHVFDYQQAGADGLVQVATRYLASGERPSIFGDILVELTAQ